MHSSAALSALCLTSSELLLPLLSLLLLLLLELASESSDPVSTSPVSGIEAYVCSRSVPWWPCSKGSGSKFGFQSVGHPLG